MIYTIATSILLFCASIAQAGVVEPPPSEGACCEAYAFVIGENFGNLDSNHVIDEIDLANPGECCAACKETEGCLGYFFVEDEPEAGVCVLLDAPHVMDGFSFIPAPIYIGNNIAPESELSTCTTGSCTNEIDIFVVLDKSESVLNNGDSTATQNLLEHVLSRFYVGNDELGARVSVTMFGGSAKKLIRLDSPEATDMEAIVDAVTFDEEPNLGWTDLAKTFRYLLRKEFPKSRPHAQKLILVVSDGRIVKNVGSAKRELKKAEKMLAKIQNKYDDVSLYSIGVGNFNLDNLLKLSTVHAVIDGFIGEGPLVFPLEEFTEDSFSILLLDFLLCTTSHVTAEALENLPTRKAKFGISDIQKLLKKKKSKKMVSTMKDISYNDIVYRND